jgi:acyl-coenzyme A synthetase/AMP-(fatty) acid ligase
MQSAGNSATTVYSAFIEAARQHADRPFLRAPAAATRGYAAGAIEYSYASAQQVVERLRLLYQGLGLKPGDRVALAFDSRLDVYLHLLALNAEGASIVPLNMAGSDAEVLHVIRHSESRLMSGTEAHLSRLRTLAQQAGQIRVFSVADQRDDATLTEEHADGNLRGADRVKPGPGSQANSQANAQNEAALLYTSGTTGKPKGCILSNEYFLTMGLEYNRLGGLCAIHAGDRLLTPLPPNHMNALSTSFMAMLLCGGCVIQLDRFHPGSWWKTVRDEKATIIHYLGVMPAMLLQAPPDPADLFSGQVRFGFGAGSDPRHQEVFERRFGFPLVEAWAMTETGGSGMTVAHEEPRYVGQRCIGRPPARLDVRLVDEHDCDVAPGQDGELLVRRRGDDPRKGFFSGYFRDEEATSEGWRGGWWHTGDVVRQGADRSLFFVDRRKNVIRRSGENIAAVEVEAVLMQLEAVRSCAVTAVPDEIRGDEVFAFIVSAASVSDPARHVRELFDACMEKLTYFKAPGYIALVEHIPVTASQKISRAEVKQKAVESLASGQAMDLRELKKRKRS